MRNINKPDKSIFILNSFYFLTFHTIDIRFHGILMYLQPENHLIYN